MPYDQQLAERVDRILEDLAPPQLVDKKMFGGIGYLVQGNMACGVHEDKLIVRVGPVGYQNALGKPGAAPFDITGRPMTGWVMVDLNFIEKESVLMDWVRQGVTFALTLPAK